MDTITVNGVLYARVADVAPAPEPPTILGYAVGECKTFTKHGKHVQNRQLWQAKFTEWDHSPSVSVIRRPRDGAAFIARHGKATTTFQRIA